MGRYATGLAPKFADAAAVRDGMRILDVGCGPGALAVELAGRVGEGNVAAIDPAPHFAAACRARLPGAAGRLLHPADNDPERLAAGVIVDRFDRAHDNDPSASMPPGARPCSKETRLAQG